jgi:phenylalanyl-tRNA synthetase beta subunit
VSGIEDNRPVETIRGGSLQPGTYSLLLRVTLQNTAGTFTESELAEASARIMTALKEKAGAQIRTS